MTRRAFLCLALAATTACAAERDFGGIRFRVIDRGRSPARYIVIHGNETIAKAVLAEHLETSRGRGFIVSATTRHVTIDGAKLDPNRMFSREGAEANLRLLNPDLAAPVLARVLARVEAAAARLFEAVRPPPGGLIVALHNNTTTTLIEGEIKLSSRTSLKDAGSPHEFMLCSDPADFEQLARSPYNVLLQDRPPGPDDGSLSRLAARKGIRYVNIEAGMGAKQKQREMLEWLTRALRAPGSEHRHPASERAEIRSLTVAAQ